MSEQDIARQSGDRPVPPDSDSISGNDPVFQTESEPDQQIDAGAVEIGQGQVDDGITIPPSPVTEEATEETAQQTPEETVEIEEEIYAAPALDEGAIGDFVATSLDDLRSIAESCHIQTDAVYLEHPKSDAFLARRNHGFYALAYDMRTPENMILLFSHDYENFNPAEKRGDETDEILPGHYVDPAKVNRIRIVEARDNRKDNESWVSTAHANHDEYTTLDLKNFGVLWHTDKNHFASGSIVYNLRPETHTDKKTGETKDMTRIRVLTTSGKSTPFFDFDSNFLRKLIGRLMTRGGVRKSFPREDATKVLMDDFLPRSEAVLRGIDPQDMHWSKHADDLQSPLTPRLERSWLMKKLPPPNTFLGKMLSRGVQKSIAYFQSALTSGNLIKDVATAVLKAGALMAFHFVTRGPIVMLIKGGAFLGSNVFKGLANIFKEPEVKSPFDSDQNVAHEYGEEDFLGKKGPSYYEKLAAEHAPFLRYVRYDETSARPADGTELRHTLRDDLAAENLLDPFGAPEGSVIEKRAIEGKSFLRVIQPDGIEVYILPQHRTAYARYRPELAHPKAEPMPHALRKLLKDTKNELRVYFDAAANDERGAYSIEDITGYEFEDRLIEEIRQPCKPDKTPLVQSEYLQDLAKRSREFDDGKWAKLARMFVQHASGKVPGFLTRHWYKKYTAPYEAAQTAEKQLWAVNGLPEGKKKVALPEASGPKPEPDQLKMR